MTLALAHAHVGYALRRSLSRQHAHIGIANPRPSTLDASVVLRSIEEAIMKIAPRGGNLDLPLSRLTASGGTKAVC